MAGKRVKSAGALKSELGRIFEEFEDEAAKVMREGTIKIKAQLEILTPKDTGWASKHWSIGLNASHENESVTIHPLTDLEFGDTAHVFNNVPYIKRLDEGWSMQRPSGFSHTALAYGQSYFNQQYQKLSKEKIP